MTQYDHPTAFSLWGDEERAAIDRVVRSGRFTMGEEVEAFEEEFARWHGMRHGVMVNSGSSANLVAIAALHAKESEPLGCNDPVEDYVIAPAIAWSTTYAPLFQHRMKVRLADVDETWNAPVPNWRPPLLRLVVVCSILGNPAYIEEWWHVARNIGAYLIEDNCESFGAYDQWARNLCGTTGILNTFSFFYSHQISAIEGGMILTNDHELYDLCRTLRAHGWTRDIEKNMPFEQEYCFTHFGYNVRPLEMHAAIAREQLRKQRDHGQARRANAVMFSELISDLPVTQPRWNGIVNPFGLAFECETAEARAALVSALRAAGIDCRPPTGGSFRLHPYGAALSSQATPRADAIHRRGLFLGNAPFDISDKIERAVAVMRATLERKAA